MILGATVASKMSSRKTEENAPAKGKKPHPWPRWCISDAENTSLRCTLACTCRSQRRLCDDFLGVSMPLEHTYIRIPHSHHPQLSTHSDDWAQLFCVTY